MMIVAACRARSQHKFTAAIGAIDIMGRAHIQKHARMAERAIAAVAMQLGGLNGDDFLGEFQHEIKRIAYRDKKIYPLCPITYALMQLAIPRGFEPLTFSFGGCQSDCRTVSQYQLNFHHFTCIEQKEKHLCG
jgi:hypothetical protein